MHPTEFPQRRWLGVNQEYTSVIASMGEVVAAVAAGQSAGEVWMLEHAPVITTGRRTSHDELHAPENVPVVATGRGGKATWHGPGQLVIYPIVPIARWAADVPAWVQVLLQITASVVQSFVPAAQPNPDTVGIYTPTGKIASLGLRIHRGVSSHGVSINIDLQPNGFQWIDPCGVRNGPVDQIRQYSDVSCATAAELWWKFFEEYPRI